MSHPAHIDRDPAPADGFDALDDCHRHSLIALGELSALVTRLERFGDDGSARELAVRVSRHFWSTARHHHEDEERHVFPALLNSGKPEVVQAVQRLQQDHHWIAQDWQELAPHIDAVATGQSWYDVNFMRDAAAVFTALMHDHIGLEESLIYPQARAATPWDGRREMGREMAARRRADRR